MKYGKKGKQGDLSMTGNGGKMSKGKRMSFGRRMAMLRAKKGSKKSKKAA